MKLLIISGPNTGRSAVAAIGQRLVVGRIRSSDLAVMDPRMSREHFVLVREDGRWLVRDLDSSNGTLVNERKVGVSPLQDGDMISAGDTRFRVTLGQVDTGTDAEGVLESQPHVDEQAARRTWTDDAIR